jgi:hypothetical protein
MAAGAAIPDGGESGWSSGDGVLSLMPGARLPVADGRNLYLASADNALAESFNDTLKRETSRRRRDLLRRGVMPPRDLPLGGPLQHPQAPLILRPTVPERLREPARGYPSGTA